MFESPAQLFEKNHEDDKFSKIMRKRLPRYEKISFINNKNNTSEKLWNVGQIGSLFD